MKNWYNSSSKPLSSRDWLEAHHEAKIEERTGFVRKILKTNPKKILDLGCGPGLWLQLFDQLADYEIDLIGIDVDEQALKSLKDKSVDWNSNLLTLNLDLEKEVSKLPLVDTILAFNVFSYLKEPLVFLNSLKEKLLPGGKLYIRQYDGSLLRIGPMQQRTRSQIDNSLMASLLNSGQFQHYNLDKVYQILENSNFETQEIDFETFQRTSPFPKEFLQYYSNSIEWAMKYLSIRSAKSLKSWLDEHNVFTKSKSSYFIEVDLVATLS